jgi:signal transduction histidine kinase
VKNFTRMDRDATVGPVDVVDGLKHTIEIVRPKARGKGASITIEAPAELPPVLGVAGELNQVWMNLIDNAVDAISDAGAVVIGLASHDDMVVVRVIDNGAGMTADVQKKIFDAFYTTKPVGQGTGVGLEIVKRIVTKHHGVISVESEPGRTEFTVTLPAVVAAEQANA